MWNLYSIVMFSDVDTLLDRGAAKTIDERAAAEINPQNSDPAALLSEFKDIYHSLTVQTHVASPGSIHGIECRTD